MTQLIKFDVRVLIISTWRRPESRPNHVGENNVNKIGNNYWNTLVGYLYIVNLVYYVCCIVAYGFLVNETNLVHDLLLV
jgi:Fe2+ transport system protein B